MPDELEDLLTADDSTTPEPVETPAPDPTPAAPALPPSLLSRAHSAGLDLEGIDNSDKFAEYLLDQYIQNRPYADHGRQSLARPAAAPEPQPPPVPQQEEAFDLDGHFGALWNTHTLDAPSQFALENGIVRLASNGMYEAAEGFEAMALPLLNNINQAHVAEKQQRQKLFEGNFYRNVYDGILPALKQEMLKEIQQYTTASFSARDQEAFAQKFADENTAWLYTTDGAFTPDGQKFRDTVAQLRQKGITNPQDLAELAMRIVNPQITAPPPQATNNDGRQRDEHGRFVPAGTPAPAAPPQTKQESFIESARRKAAASSNQGGYSDGGEEFTVANQKDLDNLWVSDYRKQKAVGAT